MTRLLLLVVLMVVAGCTTTAPYQYESEPAACPPGQWQGYELIGYKRFDGCVHVVSGIWCCPR